MRWIVVFLCWVAPSVTQATAPIDLQSPFLKTVIYQKHIGGYGAGPIEQKEVARGIRKNDLYEFQKEDGTLFLVSESEVLGVLPVFPSLQTPCEKKDIEAAIDFLEKAKSSLPGQPEVSGPVLEKWKSLDLVFGEIDKVWQVPLSSLTQNLSILFLGWALGLPGVLLLVAGIGLFLLRRRTGLALILILMGVGGGALFWASLQLPGQAQQRLNSSHEDDCRRIFWAVSCAKKAGLVGARTEFRIPIDAWLNFLFQRIQFPQLSSFGIQPILTKPFFQKSADGLLVHQSIQVGPILLPFAIELFAVAGKESPEQWKVKRIWMGRVPLPVKVAEKWVGRIFEAYRPFWNELNAGGTIQWKMESPEELEIQIIPEAT